MAEATPDLATTVIALINSLPPPAHVAALSFAYKGRTGKSIKLDYKGGMLKFLKAELGSKVVLMGEGNDTFVRLATPTTVGIGWVRDCVSTNGPILASMVGRLYQEAHGQKFNVTFPEGIVKFMRHHLATELSFEAQKGIEVLVDLQRRGASRAFLTVGSKKQRKVDGSKRPRGDESDEVSSGGRLAEHGLAACYAQAHERLLILGEADFSWAASLVRMRDSGVQRRRLTATSFDRLPTLQSKYATGVVDANISALKTAGASVLHGVDATQLIGNADLERRAPFDVIAFLFPHAGGASGLAVSIEENQQLLRTLLHTHAPALLAPGGEVHVTLVHRYPYTAWLTGLTSPHEQQRDTAPPPNKRPKKGGGADGADAVAPTALDYLGAVPFEFDVFGGYQHRATSKVDGGDAGALDVASRCQTHVWRKRAADAGKETMAAAAAAAGAAAAASDKAAGETVPKKMNRKQRKSEERRLARAKEMAARDGGGGAVQVAAKGRGGADEGGVGARGGGQEEDASKPTKKKVKKTVSTPPA